MWTLMVQSSISLSCTIQASFNSKLHRIVTFCSTNTLRLKFINCYNCSSCDNHFGLRPNRFRYNNLCIGTNHKYNFGTITVPVLCMSKVFDIRDCRYSEIIELAAQCIDAGGIIAVPTDTIYGFATAAQNQSAVNRLYDMKGRDPNKPIAICLDTVDSIPHWGDISSVPFALLNKLLPGPVTIVLQRTPLLNPLLNPSVQNIGIRIPKCKFMNSLCKKTGMPLALTSANSSNEPSSLSPEEFKNLWPQLSAVFHKGKLGNSPELRAGSTVVDLTKPGKYRIIRPGSALGATQAVLNEFGIVQEFINGVVSVSE